MKMCTRHNAFSQTIVISTYRVYQKKLNKPEIAHRLCKAPQCTKFFIEIGCLGTDKVYSVNRKIEKFKILKPGVVSFITS